MFNSERTIGDTLNSVRRQTYHNIDIVVVDDGSFDRSAEIVAEHMRQDKRIRLIHQPNAGVAAARNSGAAVTTAEYLAFVDADDLWAPEKIALQMEALTVGGETIGLVYCWFAQIDETGRTYPLWAQSKIEGDALRYLCRSNCVGNGSSLLVRRAAFDAVGGYDSSLRARHAQGCEDLLICLRVAEHFKFRVVPQHLVGYRQSNDNMSSDVMQMIRSCKIVLDEYRAKYPEYETELAAHMDDMLLWLAMRAVVGGRLGAAAKLLWRLFGSNPRVVANRLPRLIGTYIRRRLMPRRAKAWLTSLPPFKGRLRPLFMEQYR
jgi:glycosyltransferase involved in cell wall biosynthesis